MTTVEFTVCLKPYKKPNAFMAKELSFAFPEDPKKWSDKSIAIMQILTFKEFRAEEAKIIFFMRHD